MAVNFLASGANSLLLADGDAYAIFLAPLAQDFPECLAAKSIPFVPQIVVRYLVLESAKRMATVDCIEKPGPDVILLNLMAKVVHDVPLVQFESLTDTAGFRSMRQTRE
jgi:hypothetical protein